MIFSNSFKPIQANGGISVFANISVAAQSMTTLSDIDEYLNCPVENVLDPLKITAYLNLIHGSGLLECAFKGVLAHKNMTQGHFFFQGLWLDLPTS
jgi:hypothetical protein